ncbi:MAG: hypothetical protein Q7S87_16060 [Agitococcus sp.]|nr:hypothetical protein [Agitococcus sp.]MDO9179081.1 hypothetical protein [Agitococcus sp.]
MEQAIHTAINWLSRAKIIGILESYGFQCYDKESTQELEDALRSNIADGTIPPSALDTH